MGGLLATPIHDANDLWLVVIVRFKAVGNAPIMKQNFYKITSSNRFQAVIHFLRKELGWTSGEPLVCLGNTLVVEAVVDVVGSSRTSTFLSHLHQTIPWRTCSRSVSLLRLAHNLPRLFVSETPFCYRHAAQMAI